MFGAFQKVLYSAAAHAPVLVTDGTDEIHLALATQGDILDRHDESDNPGLLVYRRDHDALLHVLKVRRRTLRRAGDQIAVKYGREQLNRVVLNCAEKWALESPAFKFGKSLGDGLAADLLSRSGGDSRQPVVPCT